VLRLQDIISELINIENKAKEYSLSAEEEKKLLPQRIEEAKRKIDAEILADTEEKEKRIRERVSVQAEETVARIILESEERLKQVERTFAEMRGKIEDDLFNEITGR
jgi:F0F1-type ATP synthase membrane subunit b/b'